MTTLACNSAPKSPGWSLKAFSLFRSLRTFFFFFAFSERKEECFLTVSRGWIKAALFLLLADVKMWGASVLSFNPLVSLHLCYTRKGVFSDPAEHASFNDYETDESICSVSQSPLNILGLGLSSLFLGHPVGEWSKQACRGLLKWTCQYQGGTCARGHVSLHFCTRNCFHQLLPERQEDAHRA